MTLSVAKSSHKADIFVRNILFPKISLKIVRCKLTILYIQQNDEPKNDYNDYIYIIRKASFSQAQRLRKS